RGSKSAERKNKQHSQQQHSTDSSSFISPQTRINPYNIQGKFQNRPPPNNSNRSGNNQRYNQYGNSRHNNGFRKSRGHSRNFHLQRQQLQDHFEVSQDKNHSRIPISNIRLADLDLPSSK
ncbi:unnamed protein product, partial [Allacma fusca]